MSPDSLQLTVLIAAGAAVVLVPMLVLLLASRVRIAAHESTEAALGQASRQHQDQLAAFTQEYDRSLVELTHQHERAMASYARQHERALGDLTAEYRRIAQQFGLFSRRRHEVYARLYARYRRATHDFSAAMTGHEPEFQKFSRDDLLRYLRERDIHERDAADAVSAMDRGDMFAMAKLMSKLHWRATSRQATTAFERARAFEAINELYLSDGVREAIGNVRRKIEALSLPLGREQDQSDQAKRLAKQDELHAAVASLLRVMRDDLHDSTADIPAVRPELERPRTRVLPAAAPGLADRPPAAIVRADA